MLVASRYCAEALSESVTDCRFFQAGREVARVKAHGQGPSIVFDESANVPAFDRWSLYAGEAELYTGTAETAPFLEPGELQGQELRKLRSE